MAEQAAPTITEAQQWRFVSVAQAVELTQLRAQMAQSEYQKFIQTLQVEGYDLNRNEQGQLSYILKAATMT